MVSETESSSVFDPNATHTVRKCLVVKRALLCTQQVVIFQGFSRHIGTRRDGNVLTCLAGKKLRRDETVKYNEWCLFITTGRGGKYMFSRRDGTVN